MDIITAIENRHSVRKYTDRQLTADIVTALKEEIDSCNKKSGLHIQLIMNEPKAFGLFARYGFFTGVKNYIALIGEDTEDLYEKCGYYGEHIVLWAQQMGLNTCWVGGTYKKVYSAFDIKEDEKLAAIIAIGYGENQGRVRKSKSLKQLSNISDETPQWFVNGVRAAMLAPTALNQQKFYLEYRNGKVKASAKAGPYSKMDLGIVKYHFEAGAGKENFEWI